MALAMLASAAVHGMVLSTQFVQVNPRLFDDPNLPMDVVLVNAKSMESPLNPDALAQVNLAGGGNTDDERRLKSPLPASAQTQTGAEETAMQTRVADLEQQARALLSQLKTDARLQARAPSPAPRPDQPAIDASQINQQAREMAQLQARISQQWDTYQKRPKRTFVGANVKEYAFARYVEDWVAKVERVGNVNYPEAARRQGVYGSLKLTVSIRTDGSLEGVVVDSPSGSKILDAAAVKIVELASPYAAFPADMRKKTDILSITRTWTFTRSDQLVGTD
ncbi:MAG: energy transducer TonB [Hydrogenophilales bacterium 28-61-11]|nr:MAG: energy transducer TonB [Hydrogenophilales bacterium 28-61-11]OYZ57287.1 MAG: energy transducer TonB [Hydrogenophilales bacterium 16-61-112]OZA43314.1 MAG: energy transducer TonB [Hydrogenophilales bacterium 17-61-76]